MTNLEFPLSPIEKQIIEDYRKCSKEIKEAAAIMLHESAERNQKKEERERLDKWIKDNCIQIKLTKA